MTDIDEPHVRPSRPRTIEEVEALVQSRTARHRSRARMSAIAYPILTMVGTIALWEAATRAFGIPAYLLPAPSQIVLSFAEHAGLLLKHGWVTTIEIVLG